MYHIAFPKLARMAVLLILVGAVLMLGTNNAAWATPSAQQTSTVPQPTIGPGPERPRLTINQLRCSSENVLVEFTVRQIPANTTDFGNVAYVVNGQNRTAGFDRVTGGNARYVDSISRSAQPSNNTYQISAASVVLTVNGQPVSADLENPNRFTVVCKQKSNSSANCPQLSDGDSVGPDAEAEERHGQWRFRIRVLKCDTSGQFAIGLIGSGGVPAPNAGEQFTGSQIDITFFDSKGNVVPNPSFTGSMTLCFDYTSADLALAGGVGNLTIQTYDQTLLKWVALATSAGANSSVCTELPHLSTYAVALRSPAQPTPPAAGFGPIEPGTQPSAVGLLPLEPDTQPPAAVVVGNQSPPAGGIPRELPKTGDSGAGLVPTWLWALIGLSIGMACIMLWWVKIRAQRDAKDSPR